MTQNEKFRPLTQQEIDRLPPRVEKVMAARAIGIHPETFRKRRAIGYYRDIEFVQAGPHARPLVDKESLLRCIERQTVKAHD